MKRRRWFCLAALVCLQACAPGAREVTEVEAHLGRPDTRITFDTSKAGSLVIEVTSPSGIGNADLAISGPIPKKIVLRLLLKGLEKLDVAYGQTTVTASLSGAADDDVFEAIRLPSGEERDILPDSSYWMAVTAVPAGDSSATLPLQDGYIEVVLPEHFLSSGERSLTLRWVDFFR